MSLILDALNKADHERNKESPPTINSAHDEPPVYGTSPEKQHKLLFIGLIACVVIILGLGFVLIMDTIRGPDAKTQIAMAPSSNSAQASAQTNAPTNQATPPPVTRETPAPTPVATRAANAQNPQFNKYAENRKKMIAAQYEQVNQGGTETEEASDAPRQQPDEEDTSEARKNQEEVAAIYKNQTAPTPNPQAKPQPVRATPAPSVTQERVAAPRATPPPVAPNSLAAHADIGTVHDLPFSTQKELPTLMYREHNYPNNVMLNNKLISKGQQIDSNLYLEEILVDGIIVRYGNRKFKMPRLNSWVNM